MTEETPCKTCGAPDASLFIPDEDAESFPRMTDGPYCDFNCAYPDHDTDTDHS